MGVCSHGRGISDIFFSMRRSAPAGEGTFGPVWRFCLVFSLSAIFQLNFFWIAGILASGKTSEFIPFQWIEKQPPPLYEWVDTFSYFAVEDWILASAKEREDTSTLSGLTCKHNFTSSALEWIVCDCLIDGNEGSFFFSFSLFRFLFSLLQHFD